MTASADPAGRTSRRLILASASPRRRELLSRIGLRFTCRPVDVDETPRSGETATACVRRLARTKANAAAAAGEPHRELIIAADTVVVVDGHLLGKPADRQEARHMLARLAGREHEVLTGVAVSAAPTPTVVDVALTRVSIAPLSDSDIDWYVQTGEPLDKAGAYAIQGLGALFVETIAGNFSNVVGLPLPLVLRMVGSLQHDLRSFRAGSIAAAER